MIHELDKTIKNLLTQELNIKSDEIGISFNAPNGDWVSRSVNGPTLNFFLYDVRENATLRKHQWQQLATLPTPGNGRNGNGRSAPEPPVDLRRQSTAHLKRTPLMMDCFYMVTAWSPSDEHIQPAQEHWLLSRCLMALARYPILNPPFVEKKRKEVFYANEIQNEQDGEEQIRLERQTEGHRISRENQEHREWLFDPAINTLTMVEPEIRTRVANHDILTNPAEVWSALENQMKAAFSYVVTLPLDPWDQSIQRAEQVGMAEFGFGHYTPPVPASEAVGIDLEPERPSISTRHSLYRVAGTIWNIAKDPVEPAVAQTVTIIEPDLLHGTKNLGLYRRTKSDRMGRFSFQRLLPGEYVVVVGPDLEAPLAAENIVIRSSQDAVPEERENILLDLEVELATNEGS